MNHLKKNSDEPKNPLRLVLILLVFFEFLGVISLCRLLISSGFRYIITEKTNLLVFLLITILFIYSYIKKTIWAIWVAASVFPVITYYAYVKDSPDMQGWIVLIFCNLIAFSYLASKSEDYKDFLEYHRSMKENDGDQIVENE